MNDLKINGALMRDMIYTGAALLEREKTHIDALNVFPVPDGDTGTNMSMTMQGAVREVKSLHKEGVGAVAAAMSLGALKSARGNSGVILSQIFRGFAKAIGDADDMDAAMLTAALKAGTESAYKAVMKPKEGTMLTVVRMISDAVSAAAPESNIYRLIDIILESGEQALSITPELLPVLKEAGVVDSGGKGLLTIFRGFKMAIDGEELDEAYSVQTGVVPAAPSTVMEADITIDDLEDIHFGYCTEFFITHLEDSFNEAELDKFREKLIKIGDSVVVAHDADFVKVHVHSNSPGKIIQLALRLGEVDKVKIDNMRQQNRELLEALKKSEKEFALVAVSSGDGLDETFKAIGVHQLITGGQTMNPSIDTIAKAVKRANARHVFVLPNNSNIILAAQQAVELVDCKVTVIPSKTMVQGIAAAAAFNTEITAAENERRMKAAIGDVVSGSVTYAVRDTQVSGEKIAQGDIIGLMDNDIVCVDHSVEGATLALIRKMIETSGDEEPVVTLFYGEGADEENATAIVDAIEEEFPDGEYAVQSGGQPLYYYYISVE